MGALWLGLILASGPAYAQVEDAGRQRLQQADAYLRSDQPERAVELLEPLYDQAPNDASIYRTLKEAYERLKQYDDALRLVNRRIETDATPALLSEKARLLWRSDRRDAARKAWTQALDLQPRQPATYRVVHQTLRDLRRYGRAIEVLRQARSTLDRPALFRTELAYLYGLDGRHARAMEEYVALLSSSPERAGFVRSRLRPFVERGEGLSQRINVLRTAVEDAPENPAYRKLLAWLYTEDGDYAAALGVYKALDRLQEQQGRQLYTFARQAASADRFDVATQAYRVILDRHPDGPVAPRAQRALGDLYRQWAADGFEASAGREVPRDTVGARGRRYDAARAAYRTFLERYPDHPSASTVRAELGTLQLEVYRDLDAAAATLERVDEQSSDAPAVARARFDLARIALLRGDLGRARLLFSRLSGAAGEEALAHQARFELARIQFYQGAFDAALARTKAVTADPSTDVANDAIDLKVLIQENRGPDSLDTPLRLYAQAQLAERRHRYGVAAARLDSLLRQYDRHSLADEARFRRAQAHLAQGDTSAAREAFAAVPRRHPRSAYADRSLFRLARLQEAQGEAETAAATYDQLLREYPRSLHASDARSRLRALRQPQG